MSSSRHDPADSSPLFTEELQSHELDAGAESGCLIWVSKGADAGRTHRLESGQIVIGTDQACDLVLRDASISRRHVALAIDAGGVIVHDLGSTNGTTYLGQRIERAKLKIGARICIGHCDLDLLPLADSSTLPLSPRERYGPLVGSSLAMRRLYSLLEMLEKSDVPVLVEGETGTGKELVARCLHERGKRSAKPFVVIDCASVPRDLMESELFGHRRGAFTSAVEDRPGAFENADRGTVLLDEIGELPLDMQPKLLRVLESGEVRRVGETQARPVDVRIVAATNRDLADEVAKGRFRQDLYYRVAVFKLSVPALRERREDIPLLVRHLEQAARRADPGRPPLSSAVTEFLVRHDWPGNVRELRNAVQRALLVESAGLEVDSSVVPGASRQRVPAAPLPGCVDPASGEITSFKEAREQALQSFERSYLQDLWSRFDGNLSSAARAAGLDRKALRTLLRKHALYR